MEIVENVWARRCPYHEVLRPLCPSLQASTRQLTSDGPCAQIRRALPGRPSERAPGGLPLRVRRGERRAVGRIHAATQEVDLVTEPPDARSEYSESKTKVNGSSKMSFAGET